MADAARIAGWGVLALIFAMAANWGHDPAYQVHGSILVALAAVLFVLVDPQRRRGEAALPETGYMDDVIRAGVIATALLGRRRLPRRHLHRLPARLPGAEPRACPGRASAGSGRCTPRP